MTKLALNVHPKGPSTPSSKVLAQLFTRSENGTTRSQSVVLDIGNTTTLDVDPGHVVVQLQMPSGDVMTDERVIESGRDEAITFGVEDSRHEWLGWQGLVSQKPACDPATSGLNEFAISEPLVERVRLHRSGQPAIEVPLDGLATLGSARFVIAQDADALSLTIEGYTGGRILVELVLPHGRSEVVALPLPWLRDSAPVSVQLILERCAGGTRPSVIVQDPAFSSMLAYHASGNRSAAQDLAPEIRARAHQAIMEKFENPCAGAAGVLVLRRMKSASVPTHWLENLASITMIPDGAILYATHLMENKERRSDRSRVRGLLLEACRRGVPVFSECGRMLRDGLRRLAAVPDGDPEIENAVAWARELVDASRCETLFTWLASDLETLSRLAPEVVHSPSPAAPPAVAAQHVRGHDEREPTA